MRTHMTLDENPGAMLCDDCMHNGYDEEIRLFCCSDCHRDGCAHCVEKSSDGGIALCVSRGGCIRSMLGEVVSSQDAAMEDGPDPADRV